MQMFYSFLAEKVVQIYKSLNDFEFGFKVLKSDIEMGPGVTVC